jgi:sterol desaturase/sphingolipid hydroxylase (fatty acid hydroxylase superfamily)
MRQNVIDYQKFKKGEIKLPGHLEVKGTGMGEPLFSNPFLEKLTRAPIWVPQLMWTIVATVFFIIDFSKAVLPVYQIILLGIGGALSWSFVEYMAHRFFHHSETNSDRFSKIQHNGHWIHHLYPKDPTRLAMPPVPAIVLASFFFFLFYLLMGTRALAFFPGFMMGYVAYISFHYAQHKFPIPKKYPPLRRLWKQHIVHHYKNPYVAYGVSTNLWDFVFGTMAKDKDGKIIK